MKSLLFILFLIQTSLAADSKIKAKAESGDAKAQYELYSQMIWESGGSLAIAKEWCKKSADNGYWEAQLQVGNDLIDAKNFEGGKKYLEKAANQGSVDAINNLGYTERGSTGAKENFVAALKWYLIAEHLTKEESVNTAFLVRKMTEEEIKLSEAEAKKWLHARPKIKRAIPK